MSHLPTTSMTALVLAGQREGRIDPLADAAGISLKCLVPVAGRPMILHVLDALAASPDIGRIIVSVNDSAALEVLEPIRALVQAGRLRIVPARHNLVDSVMDALADASFPALVTTADNVLLAPDAIAEIGTGADVANADIAVAFARASSVLAAHPDGQRRFYRFSDDSYSNCNSYWLRSRTALGPIEVFRSGGQFAKHPLRIVQAFGFLNLIRFRFGIGTLEGAFRRFSRRFRCSIRPVILTDGAVAIDVDNARTLGVAEDLLHARAATMPIAAE
ncbi:spore coat biosynthesis protein F [Sphingomonas oleivorans]|uniref:Spore coat biosynthesis protein F n=1 Tax=Sphingomonas oleivorans TaxID=1735121 RepID=A0A2T5FUP2_9SPHN|nr:NTP transferase domain-containing protein [Sphingomonas oleivorans]PTQ08249.1 spore coat biosynthesis protein F [Sphingomonas oleivorans]